MTKDELKAIAKRFIQTWSVGGQKIVDELAAHNIIVSYNSWPEPVQGSELYKSILTQTFDSFPDMEIKAQEIVAEGNNVVVFWTYKATHQKGMVLGVLPSGKQVHVSGVTKYEITGGKVVEERGFVDVYSLMDQLGAISG